MIGALRAGGLAALALAIAGCGAAPKERLVVQRVEVPIHQPCRPKLDPKPAYPTEVGAIATDIWEQVRTLLVERDLRRAREVELEAAVAACAGAAPP